MPYIFQGARCQDVTGVTSWNTTRVDAAEISEAWVFVKTYGRNKSSALNWLYKNRLGFLNQQ